LIELGADAVAPPADDGILEPASLTELFIAFNNLSLQGFGGVLPVAQRVLVDRRRWMTKEQFVELLAVGQVLPGPNIINLALMYGDRLFGWRGALAAVGGMMATPALIVLALTVFYGHFEQNPVVTGALRGMGAVAAGLVTSTALKLVSTLRRNAMGVPVCLAFGAATLLLIAWLRVPLVWVLLGLGAIAITVAWKRLRVSA
jgi:chromate transporter